MTFAFISPLPKKNNTDKVFLNFAVSVCWCVWVYVCVCWCVLALFGVGKFVLLFCQPKTLGWQNICCVFVTQKLEKCFPKLAAKRASLPSPRKASPP